MSLEKEIKRKLVHMIIGLSLIILLDLKIINKEIIGLALISTIILFFVNKKRRLYPLHWFLDEMERKEDIKEYPGKGAIFFLGGVFLALLFFKEDIALASICILTIGDAISPLVGMHFGKIKNPLNSKKVIEGTIIGIITAASIASIFITYKEAIIAATVGMILESIELKINKDLSINDNLTIPLVSGITITLLRIIS